MSHPSEQDGSPNTRHSTAQQYCDALTFPIKMANTTSLGVELVDSQEFYMYDLDTALAHCTTFMAKMAKPMGLISSKVVWEVVKSTHIKAKKDTKITGWIH